MNRAQRHVFVIAIGLVIAVCAGALNRLLGDDVDGGWFIYEPNSSQPFASHRDGTIVRESLIWLGAVLSWALIAWRIYRDAPPT